MTLTSWEYLEHELAVIFGLFVGAAPIYEGDPDPAVRAYGAVVSFNSRADMLDEAARAYFHVTAGPELEAEFRELLKRCRGYSGRRNDVAHGVVSFGMGTFPIKGSYLGPSSYTSRKNPIGQPPTYAYSSKEIHGFQHAFEDIYDKLVDYEVKLDAHRRQTRRWP